MPNLAHFGLAIESPIVKSDARNFRPSTWPPPSDFPVVLDSEGQVVSKYGDHIWNISLWAKKARILNFSDGPPGPRTPCITHENAALLRQIAAWWLYGPKAVRSAITLAQRFYIVRSLFALASCQNIVASDLKRFPKIVDSFIDSISPAQGGPTLTILHSLYEQREELGFTLLDREGLMRLEAGLSNHEQQQTAYIPPRIWAYQVTRLRLFLDDFHLHREQIESCFHFCINAYSNNTGSIADACRVGRNKTWGPFWCHSQYDGSRSGRVYHGPFSQTARRFGIDKLLLKWVGRPNSTSTNISIRSLQAYFSMVGYVSIAYILNFSLMRIDEAWSLRSNCLEIENDPRFGKMYTLRGRTSKTINDNDARWPTSPEVNLAVDAMKCVARLRMICAEANPNVPTTIEDIFNPWLIVRPYEPWGMISAHDLMRPLSVRPNPLSFYQMVTSYPNLFCLNELRITQADLQVARLVNPTLNAEKFVIGEPWPFTWHQLRRTGAVNMQASGLVSDASLQYLLKHNSRAMSLYYGQGYSKVTLNQEARTVYLRTMYEVLGKEIAKLFSAQFVSPHGEKRKAEILGIIDEADAKNLTLLAKSGVVSYRETLLGGCTKRGPCPYGGVDNIVHCAGADDGNACANVLYDRERASEIHRLSMIIDSQLAEAPVDSPFRESLDAQQRAVRRALNVIRT